MPFRRRSMDGRAGNLKVARERAAAVATSESYRTFVELVRSTKPFRFRNGRWPERYLRGVDHHLAHFLPRLLQSLDGEVGTVFDFGCGSGSASTALAMVLPNVQCHGTDIDANEVSLAQARAELYGVGDRCHFRCIGEGEHLPVPSDQFDLCMCCSVLEYVVDTKVRQQCVQEMGRVLAPQGRLFMSVPNRLYPVEIHSRKFGWNWFPKLMKASIVGSDVWEVQHLARPHLLKLYHTPWVQLFTPWTNFCLKKAG